jgi:hypothetical protein
LAEESFFLGDEVTITGFDDFPPELNAQYGSIFVHFDNVILNNNIQF